MNLGKFVVEWRRPLGDAEKPYAYRWRLDFYYFSFRIHKWMCSDDTRAYHSHPVNMLVFILSGWYLDEWLDSNNQVHLTIYNRFAVRPIRPDYRHIVLLGNKPVWTLLFTWSKPKRWAFWLKNTLKKKQRDRYFIEHGNHICQ